MTLHPFGDHIPFALNNVDYITPFQQQMLRLQEELPDMSWDVSGTCYLHYMAGHDLPLAHAPQQGYARVHGATIRFLASNPRVAEAFFYPLGRTPDPEELRGLDVDSARQPFGAVMQQALLQSLPLREAISYHIIVAQYDSASDRMLATRAHLVGYLQGYDATNAAASAQYRVNLAALDGPAPLKSEAAYLYFWASGAERGINDRADYIDSLVFPDTTRHEALNAATCRALGNYFGSVAEKALVASIQEGS